LTIVGGNPSMTLVRRPENLAKKRKERSPLHRSLKTQVLRQKKGKNSRPSTALPIFRKERKKLEIEKKREGGKE